MTELAELLLEKEVIFSEDLEKIFGRSKADMAREQRENAAGNKIQAAGENKTSHRRLNPPLLMPPCLIPSRLISRRKRTLHHNSLQAG